MLENEEREDSDGVRSNFKRGLVHNTGAGGGLSGKIPTKIYDYLTRKL